MTGISDAAVEKLERLDRLRISGAITQEEFDSAKSSILGNKSVTESAESKGPALSPPVYSLPRQGNVPTTLVVRTPDRWLRPRITQVLEVSKRKLRNLENRTVAWAAVGSILAVVFLAILLIPFSTTGGTDCSSPIIQIFDKPPDDWDFRNDGLFIPDEHVMDSRRYYDCKGSATMRTGIGVTGLIASTLLSAGGYLATRPRNRTTMH